MADQAFILQKKIKYEQFSRRAIRSEYLAKLTHNNRSYRHILRFMGNALMFLAFMAFAVGAFTYNKLLGALIYPAYVYFQGLLLAGIMIHSHELSHNHVRTKWLNDLLGVINGMAIFLNFYSFQYAHHLHHRNIGNLDTPEAGAPVSLTGQSKIRCGDARARVMQLIARVSTPLWLLTSWPLYIYYGDYVSWLLPFSTRGKVHRKSLVCALLIIILNAFLIISCGLSYVFFYLLPALVAGNRILALTYLHHAHEDSVFFNTKLHSPFNVIMANSDRNYGKIVNFFTLNNGYHIPHHLNPGIAYYDLQKASDYLKQEMPPDLKYNYYANSRIFRDFRNGVYEQRLDHDREIYQLKFNRK